MTIENHALVVLFLHYCPEKAVIEGFPWWQALIV